MTHFVGLIDWAAIPQPSSDLYQVNGSSARASLATIARIQSSFATSYE